MKKIFLLFIIISLFVFFLAIAAKPLVLSLVKKQLSAIFTESQVNIAGLKITPLKRLVLTGIEIKRGDIYNFQISELRLSYTVASLVKRRVLKASFSGLSIDINTPQKNLEDFPKQLKLNPSGAFFIIDEIELSDSRIDIKSKNIGLKALIFARFDLNKQQLRQADISCTGFYAYGLYLDSASLKIPAAEEAANLYIQGARLNKIKIPRAEGRASLENGVLSISSLFAKALEGIVRADLIFSLAGSDYRLRLEANDINVENLVKDLELEDKFFMTGNLSGTLDLKGGIGGISLLKGGFSLAEPGGRLVVKDKGFLENLAKSSNQSLQIIVESFSDYHYNIGKLGLGLERNNLLFDLSLDGRQGKRNLSIVLHDF